MTESILTILLILALLGSAMGGLWVRHRLHDRHLTEQSISSIRLLMGMLLTFSALVLGLLTSNAKQRFDGLNDNLSAFATDLLELNHRLIIFGPEADDARRLLRQYTAASIADTWPQEPLPTGDYPRFPNTPAAKGLEGQDLGALLDRVDLAIDHLVPEDEFHRQVAASLRMRIISAIGQRWRLIFASRSTIAWPFLSILMTWLCIIFAIFGMTSPPSRVVYVVAALTALSIASPLYLIIDYSDTLSGTIALSSETLRVALAHMDTVVP